MSDPLPPDRAARTRTIAVVTILVAFFAGVVAGMVGERVWSFRHMPGRGMRSMAARIAGHLDRELDLTDQQREQVTRILEQHQQRVTAITATTRPQIRREIDQGTAEIERILTPEQRTKFRQMRMRMRREPPPGF